MTAPGWGYDPAMSDATFITTIVSMCVAFLGAVGLMTEMLTDALAQIVAEHAGRLK